MSDLHEEFEQLFRNYEDTWNSQEYARLKEYWDEDDPDPFYLAEEQDDWKFGWPAVERYWEPVPGKSALESIWMRYREIRVKIRVKGDVDEDTVKELVRKSPVYDTLANPVTIKIEVSEQ